MSRTLLLGSVLTLGNGAERLQHFDMAIEVCREMSFEGRSLAAVDVRICPEIQPAIVGCEKRAPPLMLVGRAEPLQGDGLEEAILSVMC